MATFLKKLRQKQNISQEFLAKKLGISRPTYAQIEKGERDISLKEAKKIADFFGLSLDDFLSEKITTEPKLKIEKTKPKKKVKKQEMRISVPQEKIEIFKEVLLYVLEKLGARPNVGEAVICKLMYFIDFDYYEKFEEQLTGAKYIKNHFGPTPAGFLKIIKEMEKNGDLKQVLTKYFQHDQKKYLPIRPANLENLSARAKDLIDWEIERFKDYNATKMKKLSHKDVPWISAEDGKIIDYESVFYRTPELSVREYNED